jgi:hypothetical protein
MKFSTVLWRLSTLAALVLLMVAFCFTVVLGSPRDPASEGDEPTATATSTLIATSPTELPTETATDQPTGVLLYIHRKCTFYVQVFFKKIF